MWNLARSVCSVCIFADAGAAVAVRGEGEDEDGAGRGRMNVGDSAWIRKLADTCAGQLDGADRCRTILFTKIKTGQNSILINDNVLPHIVYLVNKGYSSDSLFSQGQA
ncbi:hypothetical protein CEXT_732001 [Caerostris extrusa]|uniref:Uncharacterized protein n=1 Tax=Caerostris extrusa TaxID=172846 RepID=A0AAV4XHR1_CAEEX|nr:hypothetical protein CEXT_732001 [Caerostris extrusa]